MMIDYGLGEDDSEEQSTSYHECSSESDQETE